MLKPRHRAVVDALLPGLGPDFDAFLADFNANGPLPMRLAWRAALSVGAWVAPLLIGRLPPISRLSPEDGAAALEALGQSRVYLLRQQLLLLKSLVSLHYGARARTRAELGIAP